MSNRIIEMLQGVSQDEELKTAAAKIANEPEQGYPNKGETRSEVDNQMGNTEMDNRAVLHEKALEAAGRQLEANTWQDPREALTSQATAGAGAQNVAPSDAGRNVRETKTNLPESPKTAGAIGKAVETAKKTYRGFGAHIKTKGMGKVEKGVRTAYRTAKKHPGVAAGAAGAAAAAGGGTALALKGRSKKASLADYWDICNREDGEKIAAETLSPADAQALDAQALTGMFMGRAAALGQIKEAAGL
jgi:hypothetical protein